MGRVLVFFLFGPLIGFYVFMILTSHDFWAAPLLAYIFGVVPAMFVCVIDFALSSTGVALIWRVLTCGMIGYPLSYVVPFASQLRQGKFALGLVGMVAGIVCCLVSNFNKTKHIE